MSHRDPRGTHSGLCGRLTDHNMAEVEAPQCAVRPLSLPMMCRESTPPFGQSRARHPRCRRSPTPPSRTSPDRQLTGRPVRPEVTPRPDRQDPRIQEPREPPTPPPKRSSIASRPASTTTSPPMRPQIKPPRHSCSSKNLSRHDSSVQLRSPIPNTPTAARSRSLRCHKGNGLRSKWMMLIAAFGRPVARWHDCNSRRNGHKQPSETLHRNTGWC